jgi:hypothetical protein
MKHPTNTISQMFLANTLNEKSHEHPNSKTLRNEPKVAPTP